MKTCEKYALALSALLDGELSEQERQETMTHLESCEACRAYFAELTAMHEALGAMEEIEVPENFADGVLNRLHEEKKPQKKATPRKKWMGLAACAAVVVLVGAYAMPNLGGKRTETEAAEMPKMAADAPAEVAHSEAGSSVQYLFEENKFAVEDCAAAEAANGTAELVRVYALSDEAEQYLIEQGCEIYEQNDEICSYRAPIEVVCNMAALGLIDENGEELVSADEMGDANVEIVVRMAQRGGDSAANPSQPAESPAEQSVPAAEHEVLP